MKNISEKFEKIATMAAREAGKLLLERLGKHLITGSQYGTELCPKTKEDEDSELKIVEIIKSEFTSHGFVGEELGEQNSNSPYKWIIDPIDGTNNYIDGRDSFSVSIGLEFEGEIILGAVYLPKRDELFLAKKGAGATLNGKSIHPGNNFDLLSAIVTYSTFPGNENETENLDKKILDAIPNVKYFGYKDKKDLDLVFGRGSMAAEFCYLACGRIDGLIRLKQKPWDVAAGSLIAKEAGVEMLNLQGKECSVYEGDYIAANPQLLQKIMRIIQK